MKYLKNNKELLETKEVESLVKYTQEMHEKSYKILKKYRDFHDFVLEKIVYSDVMLVSGEDSKNSVKTDYG